MTFICNVVLNFAVLFVIRQPELESLLDALQDHRLALVPFHFGCF